MYVNLGFVCMRRSKSRMEVWYNELTLGVDVLLSSILLQYIHFFHKYKDYKNTFFLK